MPLVVRLLMTNDDFKIQDPVHTTLRVSEKGGFTLKTHQMFSVHTTLGKSEKGGFTLKTHQMFSVHTTPKEFENTTITGQFGFVFEENSVTPSFSKSAFSKMFSVQFLGCEGRFGNPLREPPFPGENLRFCDGLGLSAELIKFGFQTLSGTVDEA